MIIFDDKMQQSLIDFGVKIPLSKGRAEKAFNSLKNNPQFKDKIGEWFIPLEKNKITKDDLLRVHSKEYVDKLYSDSIDNELIRTYELIDENGNYNRYNPDDAKLPLRMQFDNILNKVSGSYQCLLEALKSGFCFFFGGGMHHAQKDYGKGFCLINDVVIAARKLQAETNVKKIWIVDVDAHKGDGTAALTKDDNTIITLSVHMKSGWPLNEPEYDKDGIYNPSFTPGNIDIPIAGGEENLYINKLKAGLDKLVNKYDKPDIVLIVLGSDPFELDELESTQEIKLSKSIMKERDLLIYNFFKELKIPQALLMAGGYGEHSWEVYEQFLKEVLKDRLS